MSRLTDAERETLMFAMCAPDPDRAPVTEIQLLHLNAAVERILDARLAAERERIAQEIEVAGYERTKGRFGEGNASYSYLITAAIARRDPEATP